MIKDFFIKCRNHASKYNVGILSVLFDYLHAKFCYGFCGEDYFLNTTGYAMKNFQKRQFFSHKEWLKIRKQLNDEKYTYILSNKVETLKYFREFIKHDWCYPREHKEEQFNQFVDKHRQIICKPISEEGGKGIVLYQHQTFSGGIKS